VFWVRAPSQRAGDFAQLKTWWLLRRARCSTRRIGTAVHTLLPRTSSGGKRLIEATSASGCEWPH
jgi:hypothetical protein